MWFCSFLPFWEQCVATAKFVNTETQMATFDKLYNICGNMVNGEVVKLMQAAGEFVDNPNCEINTDMIMSKSDAAAPCTEDESTMCAASLESAFTCEKDFCPTCDQAHSCDK